MGRIFTAISTVVSRFFLDETCVVGGQEGLFCVHCDIVTDVTVKLYA